VNEKVGSVKHTGQKRTAYKVLIGTPEEKGSVGRLRSRRQDNFKVDRKEVGWKNMGCIYLAVNRDTARLHAHKYMILK
jgi:hypothetical protein